jgi:ABC-type transporter Mla MlaB component
VSRLDPANHPDPAPGATPDAERAVVVLAGPLDPATLAALTSDIERLLEERDVQVVVCDVERHPAADLRVVETLARLALTAKRLGRRIRVRHASPEVRSFLAFAGLAEVLPCEGSGPGRPPGGASVQVGR